MVTVGDLWTVDLTQACSEVALKQQQNYTCSEVALKQQQNYTNLGWGVGEV